MRAGFLDGEVGRMDLAVEARKTELAGRLKAGHVPNIVGGVGSVIEIDILIVHTTAAAASPSKAPSRGRDRRPGSPGC